MQRPGSASLFDSRIPSLDGLRAVAIGWVITCHTVLHCAFLYRHDFSRLRDKLGSGWLGVDVFYVLSDFLITGLLLREYRSHGRIDWGRILARRAFRILPAYVTWLLIAAGLNRLGLLWVSNEGILAAALFYSNYTSTPLNWPLAHTWSLSIEEQFYLAWSWIFRILGPRGSVGVALAVFAASPFVRASSLAMASNADEVHRAGVTTHTHADMLRARVARRHLEGVMNGIMLAVMGLRGWLESSPGN